MEHSTEISRFFALLGMPRSGTTLAAALIDAHQSVELFYEPYNSSQQSPPGVCSTATEFCDVMQKQYQTTSAPDISVCGFKETSELPETIRWTRETLNSIVQSTPTRVLWIVRNPYHIYLSKVDGARQWWGLTDLRVSMTRLEKHLRRVDGTFAMFDQISRRHGGLVFSYKALLEEPEKIMSAVMQAIGLDFQSTQMSYFEKGEQAKVRGDVGIARDPKPVDIGSHHRRALEAKAIEEEYTSDPKRPRYDGILDFVNRLDDSGYLTIEPREATQLYVAQKR